MWCKSNDSLTFSPVSKSRTSRHVHSDLRAVLRVSAVKTHTLTCLKQESLRPPSLSAWLFSGARRLARLHSRLRVALPSTAQCHPSLLPPGQSCTAWLPHCSADNRACTVQYRQCHVNIVPCAGATVKWAYSQECIILLRSIFILKASNLSANFDIRCDHHKSPSAIHTFGWPYNLCP
jgi:hypothetical protein